MGRSVQSRRTRLQATKELEVAARKLVGVREGRDLRDTGDERVAPCRRRGTKAGEAAAEELSHQFRVPARARERILDTCAPAIGAQAGVAGDGASVLGAAVEIERVREREADEIAHRLTGDGAALPVDDPGDLAPVEQDVPEPQVAVHGRAGHALLAQPRVALLQATEIVVELLVAGAGG